MLSPLDLPCGNGLTSISDLEMAPILEESSGGIIERMKDEFLNFKLFLQNSNVHFSFSDSEEWKEQKRYTMRVLRDFGFGKSSMEGMIHEEVQKLIDSLDPKCGKPVNLRYSFNLSIINGLWAITTGNQMAIDDPKLIKMVQQIEKIFVATGERKVFNGFPWLRFIAPKACGWDEMYKISNNLIAFIEDTMKPYLAAYNADGKHTQFLEVSYFKIFISFKYFQISPKTTSSHFYNICLPTNMKDLFRVREDCRI